MEMRKHMRKRITMLIVAATMALTMSLGGTAAFAGVDCTGSDKKNNCFQNGGKFVGPGNKHPQR
jgi:hypothetical protein